MEECERAFHGTRLRVSTDHVGMAKLKEGLELVRIGEPLRPEFAAWRYGDQFGRRRRRAMLIGGGVVVAVGAVVAGAAAVGASVGSFGGLWGNIPNIINSTRKVKVKTQDGRVLTVRGTAFNATLLSTDPDTKTPVLKFKHKKKEEVFEGEEAVRVATTLLPAVNFGGASKKSVKAAVERLETFNGSEGYLDALWAGKVESLTKTTRKGVKPKPLPSLPGPTRITLEMALPCWRLLGERPRRLPTSRTTCSCRRKPKPSWKPCGGRRRSLPVDPGSSLARCWLGWQNPSGCYCHTSPRSPLR
jgi:hypothetical protein